MAGGSASVSSSRSSCSNSECSPLSARLHPLRRFVEAAYFSSWPDMLSRKIGIEGTEVAILTRNCPVTRCYHTLHVGRVGF